jgi:RNase P subunit RPR2
MRAIVTCEECGQRNRLPENPGAPGKRIICGKCREPLVLDEDQDDDVEEDEL